MKIVIKNRLYQLVYVLTSKTNTEVSKTINKQSSNT